MSDPSPNPADETESDAAGDWPGQAEGLSLRESEILQMITWGLSNEQIAARSFLSINSVKSSIRSCYRKMSLSTRSHAVLWGVAHGLHPDLGPRVSATSDSEPGARHPRGDP